MAKFNENFQKFRNIFVFCTTKYKNVKTTNPQLGISEKTAFIDVVKESQHGFGVVE